MLTIMKNSEILLLAKSALEYLLGDETLHSVTVFAKPLKAVKSRLKVTRAKNGNGYSISVGPPNYKERKHLKFCKKAGTLPRWYFVVPFAKQKKAA